MAIMNGSLDHTNIVLSPAYSRLKSIDLCPGDNRAGQQQCFWDINPGGGVGVSLLIFVSMSTLPQQFFLLLPLGQESQPMLPDPFGVAYQVFTL